MTNKKEYKRESKYKLNIKIKKKVMDVNLGEIILIFNEEFNPTYYSKEKNFNNENEFLKEIDDLNRKLLLSHDYIINLLDYSCNKEIGFCHKNYNIETYYNYYSQNLSKDIKERKTNKNKMYTSEELTNLLYQQVLANSFLQKNEIYHGDINPGLIFITKENKFKLALKLINIKPEESLFNKITSKTDIYSSPELLSKLKNKNKNKNIDYSKSDVFSLGLCILEAGLLKDVNDIYYDNTSINEGILNKYLQEFENNYNDNPLLHTTTSKMLEIDIDKRVNFEDIINSIPDYIEILDYFENIKNGFYNEEDNCYYEEIENSPIEKLNDQYFKFENKDINQNNSNDVNIFNNSNDEFYNNGNFNFKVKKNENAFNSNKKKISKFNNDNYKNNEIIPPKPKNPPKAYSLKKMNLSVNNKNIFNQEPEQSTNNIDNFNHIKNNIEALKNNNQLNNLPEDIKIEYFNDIPHKELREETFEINEDGKKIKKIIIRYTPINNLN